MYDVTEIFRYWRDYPPTHVLVGAYFGLGKSSVEPTDNDIAFTASLPVRSYDNLPTDIQEWLRDIKKENLN